MAKRDYYEVIGVGRDMDQVGIKKAYRTLALKYHPDRNPGDDQAVERMKEINEAYAVLSDTQKRTIYDTYGHGGLEGYAQEDIFRGVDFSSLFQEFDLRDFFGVNDGLFESFLGGRATSRTEQRRGADLRYDLDVSLEEVAFGGDRTIELSFENQYPTCNGTGAARSVACDACRGTGQIVREQRSGLSVLRQISTCGECRGTGESIKEACKTCDMSGVVQRSNDISVTIPPGADTGHMIRVEGKGQNGQQGAGDLYVVLNVQKHPVFKRRDDDIFAEQGLDFTIAALGGEMQVPGLDGDLKVDVPEGTQSGAALEGPGPRDSTSQWRRQGRRLYCSQRYDPHSPWPKAKGATFRIPEAQRGVVLVD